MKKAIILVSVLSLLVVGASSALAEDKPIKFGIMGPMGDATGLNVLRPAELMIKKINSIERRKILI